MPGPKIPTEEEVAYMVAHADDDIRVNVVVCASICAVLATLFVAFRLWSRRISKGRLRLEASDWLTIAAWTLYIPLSVTLGVMSRYGVGRHIIFVTNAKVLQILVILVENLYIIILGLLKWSILSLYRSLFGTTIWLYRLSWAVSVLVGCLVIQVILSTNLQCIPLSYTWDLTQEGKCIDYGTEALVAYIINIITDLIIVTMPIPVVLHLQASKSTRQGLLVVFCAGGSACIVSIVQLAFVTKLGSTSDPSWDNAPTFFIGEVEIMVGFLATSIATYRPLYLLIFRGGMSTAYGGYLRQGKSDNSNGAANEQSHSKQFGDQISHTPRIFGTGKHVMLDDADGESGRGITVTNEIELEAYDQNASQYRERW